MSLGRSGVAEVKTEYAAPVAMTITLASLADSSTAGRESLVVDNSVTKYLDALVQLKVKPQNSGSISAPSCIFVYAYASADGGSDYPDKVTGANADITLDSPTNLKLLGVVYVSAIGTEYSSGPWSVAALYGGKLPEKWGIVVQNDCGTALSATAGDHALEYQGVYATVG